MRQWSGSTDVVKFPAEDTTAHFNAFTFATVMIRTASPGSYREALNICTSGNSEIAAFSFTNADNLFVWHNAFGAREMGMSYPATDGLLLAASTWDGTGVVWGHKYVWSTGTWTRNSVGGWSVPNAPGSGAQFRIGINENNDVHQGHIAALALWSGRAMSDTEVERLSRGRWSETNPSFHVEFPSGVDDPANARELSRMGRRQTSVTGTGRSAVADPPGFDFSPQNRRR